MIVLLRIYSFYLLFLAFLIGKTSQTFRILSQVTCSFANLEQIFAIFESRLRLRHIFVLGAHLFGTFWSRVRLPDFDCLLDKYRNHLRFKLKIGTEKFRDFPCKNYLLAWPSPHCLRLTSHPSAHPNSPSAATET